MIRNKLCAVFVFIWFILIVFNILFPLQTDDIGHYIYRLNRIDHTFLTPYFEWNGRFFEQVWLYCFSLYSDSLWFDILNAFVGSCFILTFYFCVFAKYPKTNVDFLIIGLICVMVINSVFATVFLWGAGSLNYLWAMEIILIFLIPYRIFWERAFNVDKSILKSKLEQYLIFFTPILGIVAGWSSEHVGAVLCLVLILSLLIAWKNKINLPLWYHLGVYFFCIGWLILFFSPGSTARGLMSILSYDIPFVNREFVTIHEFFQASFSDQILRINATMNTSCRKSFGIFLLTLLWFYLWKINLGIKRTLFLGILFSCVISIYYFLFKTIFALPLYFVALFCILLLIIRNHRYILFVVLFVIWLLIGLMLVQFHGQVGLRARMGEGLILASMILIMFREFYLNSKYQFITQCFVVSILTVSIIANFVNWGLYRYNWEQVLIMINEKKKYFGENAEIVIPKELFYSFYDKDFGGLGNNPENSVNKSYAKYFGVKKIIVK